MSATTSIASLLQYWKSFELPKLQKELDDTATEIAARQDESEVSRKKLVELSKEFKTSTAEDIRKAVGPLLKSFQAEIDSLSKRSKAAETSFLNIYKKLLDLPDPIPALDQLSQLQKKAQRTIDLEVEVKNLRETLEQYNAEFAEVKNQEVTIRQLKEKVKVYEEQLEHSVQAKVQELQQTLKDRFEAREKESQEATEIVSAKLLESERRIQGLQAALTEAQRELYDLRSAKDDQTAMKSNEVEMLISESDRASQRATAAERECEMLKEELKRLKENSPSAARAFADDTDSARTVSLEAEIGAKDKQINHLLQEAQKLQLIIKAFESGKGAEITEYQTKLNAALKRIEDLERQLKSQTDYEDIKRELNVIKSIEFGAEQQSAAANGELAEVKPLEKLLLEKNKSLQAENTTLKLLSQKIEGLSSPDCTSRTVKLSNAMDKTEEVDANSPSASQLETPQSTPGTFQPFADATGQLLGQEFADRYENGGDEENASFRSELEAVLQAAANGNQSGEIFDVEGFLKSALLLDSAGSSGFMVSPDVILDPNQDDYLTSDWAQELEDAVQSKLPRELIEGMAVERLQEVLQPSLDAMGTNTRLNTVQIAMRCKQALNIFNIGQRQFAKSVLNQSQGALSELLAKAKPWERLTDKGRESFRRIFAWTCNVDAINVMRYLCPRRSSSFGKNTHFQASYTSDLDSDVFVKQEEPEFDSEENSNQQPDYLLQAMSCETAKPGPSSTASQSSSSNNNAASQKARSYRYRHDDIPKDKIFEIYQRELSKLQEQNNVDKTGKESGRFSSPNKSGLRSSNNRVRRAGLSPATSVSSSARSDDQLEFLSHSAMSSRCSEEPPLPCAPSNSSKIILPAEAIAAVSAVKPVAPSSSRSRKKDVCVDPLDELEKEARVEEFVRSIYRDAVAREKSKNCFPASFSLTSPGNSVTSATPRKSVAASSGVSSGERIPCSASADIDTASDFTSAIKSESAVDPLTQIQSITNSILSSVTATSRKPSATFAASVPLSATVSVASSANSTKLLKAVLPAISQEQFDSYHSLDTDLIVSLIKEFLAQNSISQRIFGEIILGLSQGSVSDLLARPKPWNMLTQKGKEPFIRMQIFLDSPEAIERLLNNRNAHIGSECCDLFGDDSAANRSANAALIASLYDAPKAESVSDVLRKAFLPTSPSKLPAKPVAESSPVLAKRLVPSGVGSPPRRLFYDIKGVNDLNTTKICERVKSDLTLHNISLKIFADSVVGPLPVPISELLSRPKPWKDLKPALRDAFARMFRWIQDPRRIRKLQEIYPSIQAANVPRQNNLTAAVATVSNSHHVHVSGGGGNSGRRIIPALNLWSAEEVINEALQVETSYISDRVRAELLEHNIGQKLFGEAVVGLSQGSVSELLSKPKTWDTLSVKGRDSYARMYAWLHDSERIQKLEDYKKSKAASDVASPTQCSVKPRMNVSFSNGNLSSLNESGGSSSSSVSAQNASSSFDASKRQRLSLSDAQRDMLNVAFMCVPYPTASTIEYLSSQLSLPEQSISNWFHNRRMRSKGQSLPSASALSAAADLDANSLAALSAAFGLMPNCLSALSNGGGAQEFAFESDGDQRSSTNKRKRDDDADEDELNDFAYETSDQQQQGSPGPILNTASSNLINGVCVRQIDDYVIPQEVRDERLTIVLPAEPIDQTSPPTKRSRITAAPSTVSGSSRRSQQKSINEWLNAQYAAKRAVDSDIGSGASIPDRSATRNGFQSDDTANGKLLNHPLEHTRKSSSIRSSNANKAANDEDGCAFSLASAPFIAKNSIARLEEHLLSESSEQDEWAF